MKELLDVSHTRIKVIQLRLGTRRPIVVAFDRCESLFCRSGFIFHLIRRQAANKIRFPRVLSGTSREVRDANCIACVAIGAKIAPRQPSGKLRADMTAFSARVAFLFTADSKLNQRTGNRNPEWPALTHSRSRGENLREISMNLLNIKTALFFSCCPYAVKPVMCSNSGLPIDETFLRSRVMTKLASNK